MSDPQDIRSAARDAQIAAYRRMTPAEKLAVAFRLRRTARELKAAALRAEHPDWSEQRVQFEVTEVFRRAGS